MSKDPFIKVLNGSALLGVVFLILKITGIVSWPWRIVLFPFYGPYLLILFIITTLLVFAIICVIIVNILDR